MTTAARRMVRQRTDAIPVSDETTFGGPTKFNGSVKELVQYYNYNPVQDAGDFGKDFTGRCQFKIGHPDMSPRLDDIDGGWTDKRLADYKNYIPYDGVSPKYTFGKQSTICDKVDDLVHAKWQHEYHAKMEEKLNHIAGIPREEKMHVYSSSHDKTVNTKRNFCPPKEKADLTKTCNQKEKVKRMALNKNFFLNKLQCAETSRAARAGYIGEQIKNEYDRAMRYVRRDKPFAQTSRTYSEEPSQITGDSANFQPNPKNVAKRFNVRQFKRNSGKSEVSVDRPPLIQKSVDRLPSIINTEHKPVCIPSKINQTEC